MTSTDVAFHDWHIEEREYLRLEERRGRRHAFETLDPTRTALVVIDVVPFFVEESAYCRGIIPQVNLLAEELRSAGGTVAWVVPGYREPTPRDREHRGEEIAERYARSGGPGTPAERLWPELAVADGDVVAEKTAYSAFFPGSSDLPALLAARGVDTVVVTGTVTNVCVEASVRDAATLDLRVILVADACAATRDRDHNATLHVVHRSYGDVRPTAEVVDLIRAGRR
ncbi:isochorismatase family cysteine hydrolase [Nocardioides sp. Soil805]|uniref:isochorismatase family cysteine hydrolase n=1 Tax=Nocardioides sp. Soil805 TaxID=1736416 RepID=UPI0007030376|nr:isochorismatase family cysteine hydrolase [Nocardioides sp. Soil805]KRF35243.1 isochorismatase [Nocardioides sp. Soil805]